MNREVDSILFARPEKLKVFVSSQMRGSLLIAERQTAAKAINKTGFALAWLWENNACTGPYSAEAVCLGHARTSDGLVLILADQLTPITQKEYEAAHLAGVPCYIFLKQGARRDRKAERFVREGRAKSTITANFKGLSELETQVTGAIFRYAVDSIRERILDTKKTRISPMQKALAKIQGMLVSSDRKES
jgi:hypothetical protein